MIFVFITGRGGASIFGKQFEDELNPELKFTGNYSGKITVEQTVADVGGKNVA